MSGHFSVVLAGNGSRARSAPSYLAANVCGLWSRLANSCSVRQTVRAFTVGSQKAARALGMDSFVEFARVSHRRGRVLAVWAIVLLSILPMYEFGQREHLALLAMLPAIGVYILRGNREPVTPAAVLIAALSAAITLSFKPYFAFAVGFCIFTAAAQARDWRVVFAPENWTAAGLVVVYGICIFVFYPEYFTVIYPLARDVYLLLKAPTLALFVSSATALWVGAVMIVLALRSQQRKLDAASFVLLAASFGFAIAFFVQRKGWGYHAYPMVALGLLAVGCAISAIDHGRRSSRRLRVAAMFVVL